MQSTKTVQANLGLEFLIRVESKIVGPGLELQALRHSKNVQFLSMGYFTLRQITTVTVTQDRPL